MTKATPIINWPTPAAISTYNAAEQHPTRCHRNVPGRHSPRDICLHVPPARGLTVRRSLPASHTLKVVFTPTDTTDYTTATATVQIVVGTTAQPESADRPYSPAVTAASSASQRRTPITVTGSTARSNRNRERGLQWSDSRHRHPHARIGCDLNPRTCTVNSIYFFPGNNTVTLQLPGRHELLSRLSSSAVIPLRNPAISANPAAVDGGTRPSRFPTPSSVDGTITFNFTPAGGAASDFQR